MSAATRQRGFTLIETLIALAVVATALGAILHAIGTSTGQTAYLQEKLFATWIGENHIAELRLTKSWPPLRVRNGQAEMAGETWGWQETVSQTQLPDMRRVEIAVYPRGANADQRIATVIGFVVNPARRGDR